MGVAIEVPVLNVVLQSEAASPISPLLAAL